MGGGLGNRGSGVEQDADEARREPEDPRVRATNRRQNASRVKPLGGPLPSRPRKALLCPKIKRSRLLYLLLKPETCYQTRAVPETWVDHYAKNQEALGTATHLSLDSTVQTPESGDDGSHANTCNWHEVDAAFGPRQSI